MNDIIGKNIKKHRELKGYSQEYMAHELSINQSTYAKLENNSTQITIERIFTIAKILETDISELMDLKKQTIFNQTNNRIANAIETVGNFHQEGKDLLKEVKETYNKLIASKDEQIELLKTMLERSK